MAASTEGGPVCFYNSGSTGPLESGLQDNKDKDDDDEEEDTELEFKANQQDVTHPTVAPMWPTRVFATECLQKILVACEGVQTNFDLELAREIKIKTKNLLVLHLSELVRMAFIAATSDSNQLRLAWLSVLQDIITKFATVPEPEFPGHVILEQFQAQVSATLRPAFSPDTSSDVTASTCDVCSTWIGSGVARDLNDLRRVRQLLVSSLAKLNAVKSQSPMYNESAVTMEKLAVLGAWAEVYIVAVEREHEKETKPPREEDDYGESSRESLLSLVQPEFPTLSQNWLGALRDYAYLSLPTKYSSQLPSDGGTFYHPDTVDNAKPHFKKLDPHPPRPGYLAPRDGVLWGGGGMNKESDKNSTAPANAPANMKREEINSDSFYLILGICVEALSNPQTVLTTHAVNGILKALSAVLTSDWPKQQSGVDPILSKEVLNVMHRVFLTQESVTYTQLLAVKVVKAVLLASKDCLQQDRTKFKEKEMEASTSSSESMDISESSSLGDGGEEGDIIPEKSVVYAALEVCLCVISRQIPALTQPPAQGFRFPPASLNIRRELFTGSLHCTHTG